jgi:hypothetical protein
MALSDIEQVRMGIGDITIPYILSDEQIQHYLDSNSGDVNETIVELQPIVLSVLASQGNANRVEELWEDTTKRADAYDKAMTTNDRKLGQKASPMIGGSTTASPFSVDQFDPEEIY